MGLYRSARGEEVSDSQVPRLHSCDLGFDGRGERRNDSTLPELTSDHRPQSEPFAHRETRAS